MKTATQLALVVLVIIMISLLALGEDHQKKINQDTYAPLPLIGPSSSRINNSLFWGTYRPSLYFGFRTRSFSPLRTGLMWSSHPFNEIRHWCEDGDKLKQFGWLEHDGWRYGVQEIKDLDKGVSFKTSFVKYQEEKDGGGDWSNRFEAIPSNAQGRPVVLYFYLSLEEGKLQFTGKTRQPISPTEYIEIIGESEELGKFCFYIKSDDENVGPEYSEFEKRLKGLPDLSKIHFVGLNLPAEDQWQIKQKISGIIEQDFINRIYPAYLKGRDSGRLPAIAKDPLFIPTLPNSVQRGANVFVFQFIFNPPFKVDVVYLNEKERGSSRTVYGSSLTEKRKQEVSKKLGESFTMDAEKGSQEFRRKFDQIFKLSSSFDSDQQKFARAALSNLIGGVGFFNGNEKIADPREPSGWRFTNSDRTLFSASPTRAFFPRGFLWDEGFHQLLLSRWDPILSIEVLRTWLNSMEVDGWIPRERILGEESRARVPAEFQVQSPEVANPPTILLPTEYLARRLKLLKNLNEPDSNDEANRIEEFLLTAYPRLERFIEWVGRTQAGPLPNTYRWRGRTGNHTLPSGLDDYPRAPQTPWEKEAHLDLFCWMAFAVRTLESIRDLLSEHHSLTPSSLLPTYSSLSQDLNRYWDDKLEQFSDVSDTDTTLHSGHLGYVAIFPLALGVIPPSSPKLEKVLRQIRDEQTLWSNYGIRSLSREDPLFGTEENYWRGAIWININYLVLSSLKRFYVNTEGPSRDLAQKVYTDLRTNLINNLYGQYKQSGYLWEQYHPLTGQGQRARAFTGWSALITLMMAELY